jgi:hypothetical protein
MRKKAKKRNKRWPPNFTFRGKAFSRSVVERQLRGEY